MAGNLRLTTSLYTGLLSPFPGVCVHDCRYVLVKKLLFASTRVLIIAGVTPITGNALENASVETTATPAVGGKTLRHILIHTAEEFSNKYYKYTTNV